MKKRSDTDDRYINSTAAEKWDSGKKIKKERIYEGKRQGKQAEFFEKKRRNIESRRNKPIRREYEGDREAGKKYTYVFPR